MNNQSVNSSANNIPELFIPYIHFSNIKALQKLLEYYGKEYAHQQSKFTNKAFSTFACKNTPIKSN